MELWIPITIAAAFMQNLRFMLQKHLKGQLSTFGATYARFVWAAPLALVLVAVLQSGRGEPLPETSYGFFVFGAIGGITQILATALLVSLFGMRNFAVGVTFSKTETIQAALFGIVILSEGIGGWGLVAIVISLLGVVLISVNPKDLSVKGIFSLPMLIGLGSGALFGISAVSYRAASLSLGSGEFLIRAALTLALVTVLQTILMTIYLALRESGEIFRVFKAWKITLWVGVTGMLGSLGWFAAMTLQNAAYVRALGQIELVFTFAASYLFFKERSTSREVAGIVLVVVGILLLLIAR